MDIAYEYRWTLKKLIKDGHLDKDPERLMRMKDFLTCWDEWAEASSRELAALAWALKYWWFGLIPSMCVFLWAATVMAAETREKYKWFDIAQKALLKSRSETGYSVEERAAIGAMTDHVLKRVRQ